MYKDEDKQKEANRQASQRRRDADKVKGMTADVNQGMTKGMTNQGMTPHSAAASVIPCDARLKVMPYDTPDVILCEVEPERTPGDADYEPQQAFIESQGLSRTSSTKGAAL